MEFLGFKISDDHIHWVKIFVYIITCLLVLTIYASFFKHFFSIYQNTNPVNHYAHLNRIKIALWKVLNQVSKVTHLMNGKAGCKIHGFLTLNSMRSGTEWQFFREEQRWLFLYPRLFGLNGEIHDAKEPQVTGLPLVSQLAYE